MKTFTAIFLSIFLTLNLFAETLTLQGHLDDTAIDAAIKTLSKVSTDEPLKVRLSSTTAEIKPTLRLARRLYELREEEKLEIHFYLDEQVIGPAALLPFLGDKIYSSPFLAWGDAVLDEPVQINVLRSQIRSFVSPHHPRRELFQLIGEAMVDEKLIIVDDGQWRRSSEEVGEVITPNSERLVVNQNQLRELGLLAGITRSESLASQFGQVELASAKQTQVFDQLEKHIAANADTNTIGHIAITDPGGINQGTWIYVKSALDHYRKIKPAFIILELNTPGGEVFASQKISDALNEIDTSDGIPVVAYVNNWAISAGAMLAYSCRFIVIAKDAAMGAAEPVFAAGGQMQSAPEKVNSALRADFANRAGFYDRNRDIAEAMVDKDVLLVRRYGKIIKVEEARKSDEVVSAKGKLLTLTAKELMEYGVADMKLAPKALEAITDAEKSEGKWSGKKSLVLHGPFFQNIQNPVIESYQMSWQLQFLAFLNKPAIASFLFLGMMLGFYMEINTPGFGIPGALGLACLCLIMISSVAFEAASVLELLILAIGVVLLALELFVIPGFGIPGILGILLIIGGVVALMLPGLENFSYDIDDQTLNAAGEEVLLRLGWLSAAFVVGVIAIILLARYVVPVMTPFHRLVSFGEQEGYIAGVKEEELPAVGLKGVVKAQLRPSGKVEIDGALFDALSQGGFVEPGSKVRVVEHRSGRLIVEEV